MPGSRVHTRPPFDKELAPVLDLLGGVLPPTITPDMIDALRISTASPPIEETLQGHAVSHREVSVPGHQGADVIVSIFSPLGHGDLRPGIVHLHGGGMFMGDRFTGVDVLIDWVERFQAVGISVEYRLAPEHRAPTQVEDAYAALTWVADRAPDLGIDPSRLIVSGASAGGGLAAGVALLARDRRGPALFGQVLMYPMLDDRNETVSSHQVNGEGLFDRTSNQTGWNAVLGAESGSSGVSMYVAPARAPFLGALPPALIEVGSVDVFRDENVAYASQIWADGGVAELHVWPGGSTPSTVRRPSPPSPAR